METREDGKMSKQSVLIEYRSVYGQPKAYPANVNGELFAQLLGAKTFNPAQLAIIERLGFEVASHDRVRAA
jgi:hypothetical protein